MAWPYIPKQYTQAIPQPLWKWTPPPQPWICPRCGAVHGPLSLRCDCKPDAKQEGAT